MAILVEFLTNTALSVPLTFGPALALIWTVTKTLFVATDGVIVADRPVISTREDDEVVNVSVFAVLTTCKIFPPPADTQAEPL
jgi:hypothetical protein